MISLKDSLKRKNILYIHGLGSNKNSNTFKILSNEFKEYNWYTDTFDLMNPDVALKQINSHIKNKSISIIIGSSFGAFYALAVTNSLAKIVINPCMVPSVEIPKLTDDDLDVNKLKNLEQATYDNVDPEMRISTFGIFGNRDNLFSYKNKFKDLYGNKNCITVSGEHRLPKNSLIDSVKQGFEYFTTLNQKLDKLDESLIYEHFVNIFTKSDNTDKLLKFKDEVYRILQKAYAPIGGLLGCDDVDMLVNDSDFWKLCTKEGKVVAVFVYTFKRGGRKLMYCGTDGTPLGKEWFYKIIQEDINFRNRQSWAEVSCAMEHIYLKRGAIPVPADVAQKIMIDKPFIKIHKDNLHYDRVIGGETHTKIMIGFPENN